MKKELTKQIELLKKYRVSDYIVENDLITINDSLDLSSLTSADKDFLKGTTINSYLDLRSLTSADKDFLKGNVHQLKEGYNKKGGYCYFDGILSTVLSVHVRGEYTIYKTPFEFVAHKGEYTAHGKTIKKAVSDVEFKIVSEKLKKEPIKEDTVITIQHYRLITGACESGVISWMKQVFNEKERAKILDKGINAKELLPILTKHNAYGIYRFKSLITF